jgi:hypothetical protein
VWLGPRGSGHKPQPRTFASTRKTVLTGPRCRGTLGAPPIQGRQAMLTHRLALLDRAPERGDRAAYCYAERICSTSKTHMCSLKGRGVGSSYPSGTTGYTEKGFCRRIRPLCLETSTRLTDGTVESALITNLTRCYSLTLSKLCRGRSTVSRVQPWSF